VSQKFFISFNSADRAKARWIAWTLKDAGHQVAVYDWEVPAGGNAALWMNESLAWADRLIAVISPDYVPARDSPMEWASQIWSDPDGTRGSVIPVIVKPTPNMPPLLIGLTRIDLTNCTEDVASLRPRARHYDLVVVPVVGALGSSFLPMAMSPVHTSAQPPVLPTTGRGLVTTSLRDAVAAGVRVARRMRGGACLAEVKFRLPRFAVRVHIRALNPISRLTGEFVHSTVLDGERRRAVHLVNPIVVGVVLRRARGRPGIEILRADGASM
jgi:TIR domain